MNRKILLVMLLVVGQSVSAQLVRQEKCVDTTHYLRGVTGTKGNNPLLYTAGEGGLDKYRRKSGNLEDMNNIFPGELVTELDDMSKLVTRVDISSKKGYVAFITKNRGYVYGIDDDMEKEEYTYYSLVNLRAIHINRKYVYFGEKGTGNIVRVKLKDSSEEELRVTNATDNDIREIDTYKGKVIVATNDNHVYLFDEKNWEKLAKLNAEGHAEVAQIDKDYIWYASDAKMIWVHENKSPYREVAMLEGPTSNITAVRRHGKKWMFASTDAGMIHVYRDFTEENAMEVQTIGPELGGGRVEYLWLDKKQKRFYAVFGKSDRDDAGDKLICVYYYNKFK